MVGDDHGGGDLLIRFCGSTSFRFMLLAFAVCGATFAVRTSDAFQTAQIRAIDAQTAGDVAKAATIASAEIKPATEINAAEPRLLKTASLERIQPEPVSAPEPARIASDIPGLADAASLCKSFGDAVWAESALFAGHKECASRETSEGFAIDRVARGSEAGRIDEIRLKLDVEDETASAYAGVTLGSELGDALALAELQAPSGFLKSVTSLEDARAETEKADFRLEREVASPDRYTLVVATKTADDETVPVRHRP
ncbi:hypothetical protein DYI37_08670 [Fulvimarina endophytica]|uniref:Uncharacterized protein n=1 Tax=Fulvimarina endophytica TaxID=2293836 RepID=A0A371X580_9HYPH|nr:hypothetical protein DYI37_08670 [Fulvimarina endophytica]